MASVDEIRKRLRNASLVTEVESTSPLIILGGEEIRDVDGIKVYKRGFSIKKDNGNWIVKLPHGQTVEEHIVSADSDFVEMIVLHYKMLRSK